MSLYVPLRQGTHRYANRGFSLNDQNFSVAKTKPRSIWIGYNLERTVNL
jgi:hypothetical protein